MLKIFSREKGDSKLTVEIKLGFEKTIGLARNL
jgi:hypothetical protein